MKIDMNIYSEVQTKLVDELTTVILDKIGEFSFNNINMLMGVDSKVMVGVAVRADDDQYFHFEVDIKGEINLEEVPF